MNSAQWVDIDRALAEYGSALRLRMEMMHSTTTAAATTVNATPPPVATTTTAQKSPPPPKQRRRGTAVAPLSSKKRGRPRNHVAAVRSSLSDQRPSQPPPTATTAAVHVAAAAAPTSNSEPETTNVECVFAVPPHVLVDGVPMVPMSKGKFIDSRCFDKLRRGTIPGHHWVRDVNDFDAPTQTMIRNHLCTGVMRIVRQDLLTIPLDELLVMVEAASGKPQRRHHPRRRPRLDSDGGGDGDGDGGAAAAAASASSDRAVKRARHDGIDDDDATEAETEPSEHHDRESPVSMNTATPAAATATATAAAAAATATATTTIVNGVTFQCDVCASAVTECFHCLQCDEYDVCLACYAAGDAQRYHLDKHPGHAFDWAASAKVV